MKAIKYVDLDEVINALELCEQHYIGLYEDLGCLVKKDEAIRRIKQLATKMVDKDKCPYTDYPEYIKSVNG